MWHDQSRRPSPVCRCFVFVVCVVFVLCLFCVCVFVLCWCRVLLLFVCVLFVVVSSLFCPSCVPPSLLRACITLSWHHIWCSFSDSGYVCCRPSFARLSPSTDIILPQN